MRIVVTGATGFVGRELAERLSREGHQLLLQVRAGATSPLLAFGELMVTPSIETISTSAWRDHLKGVDAVVHIAAIAHIGPSVPENAYNAVNRDASGRLAEAAAAEGIKHFVFFSSIRAQVGATSDVVQTELTPPEPTEAYGHSKLEAEGLIRRWLPQATILRPAVIVGPQPKGNLATLLKLAALPVPLPLGALRAPQAMVSLDGVIDAVLLALDNPAMSGETYCLAQIPHLSLTEILTALRQGLGRPRWLLPAPAPLLGLLLKVVGRAAMAKKLSAGLSVDASKLMALGWQPREDLKTVLQRMGAAYIRR
jgi:nucleoside-diphosphate-sugar epimerase